MGREKPAGGATPWRPRTFSPGLCSRRGVARALRAHWVVLLRALGMTELPHHHTVSQHGLGAWERKPCYRGTSEGSVPHVPSARAARAPLVPSTSVPCQRPHPPRSGLLSSCLVTTVASQLPPLSHTCPFVRRVAHNQDLVRTPSAVNVPHHGAKQSVPTGGMRVRVSRWEDDSGLRGEGTGIPRVPKRGAPVKTRKGNFQKDSAPPTP